MTWNFLAGRILMKAGGFWVVKWSEGEDHFTCDKYQDYTVYFDITVPSDDTVLLMIDKDPFDMTEEEILDYVIKGLGIKENNVDQKDEYTYIMKIIGTYKEATP